MQCQNNRNRGFVLSEIMVAVVIMLLCLVPLLLLITSTRTESSRAVHRLRVFEVINETLDWIHTCPFTTMEKLAGFATGEMAGIPLAKNENLRLDPFLAEDSANVKYSNEYSTTMERLVEVENVTGLENLLKKIRVTVKWSEAGETFSYKLSTLAFNEENPDY